MDAFDADVLIYAGEGHPLGTGVRALFKSADASVGVGSQLLEFELLVRPLRLRDTVAERSIVALLGRLQLRTADASTVRTAVGFGVHYGLKCVDAIHLATAVLAGADRFITNNRRDFRRDVISEIAIVHPADLPG